MRGLQCDLIVEEELPCTTVPECQAELETVQRNIKPDLNPLDRKVLQLTFFKSTSDTDLATIFNTEPTKARATAPEDLANFNKIRTELKAIGYLHLFHDSHKGIPLSAYIPRAVVEDRPRGIDRLFVHSKAKYSVSVLGEENGFPIEGSYFAQQDGETWCCAHAAFMVAVQNLARALDRREPITIQTINDHLRIDQKFRIGRDGLDDDEIISIFNLLGVQADPWRDLYGTQNSADFVIAQAYYAVECGLPAILCFQGTSAGHAMAVVGHTFDASLWSPFATRAYFRDPGRPYLPSHSWVDALIVQDDNFGPYCSLQRSVLWEKRPVAIVPRFPGSILAGPSVAEFAAAEILLKRIFDNDLFFPKLLKSPECPKRNDPDAYWLHRLVDAARSEQMVLRTTPLSPSDYTDFLTSTAEEDLTVLGKDSSELLKKITGRKPTNFCWLIEISLPELYQWNHRRVGEVIIAEIPGDPANGKPDSYGLWLVRLPGIVALPKKDASGFDYHTINAKKHYPIVQLNYDHLRKVW